MTNTTYTDTIVAICCGECGVAFGLSRSFMKARRKDHVTWYCPNGHPRYYDDDNEVEVLQKQLDNANASRDVARRAAQNANDRAETASRSARAHKGHATRIKKRIAAGVCPCCNRTFQDLARHMEGQHPGFVEKS